MRINLESASAFIVCAAFFVQTQAAWPPASCGCSEWHRDHVESYAPFAGNTIVRVTRASGSGSISFMQFLNQLNKKDSTTYVIAADTAPYILGCRNITIGGSTPRRCIMVRGETGRREDVVMAGLDPRTSPDYWKSREYGGPGPCGIGSFIQTNDVQHFVIADLTIRNFPGKMIKIDGNAGYSGRNIILHNIELWDCGSQMVKVAAAAGVSSRECIVECSYLHYTDALFRESTYETQGVDVHKGVNWIIRYNLFRNFRQGAWGNNNNSDAILMWDYTDSVLVEGNFIINCNMGVRLASPGSGGNYMWAKNNIIVADDPDPRFSYRVGFEIGGSVTSGWIYHNTVWNTEDNGSVANCFNQIPARNNLYYGGSFSSGCNEGDNVQARDAAGFNSVAGAYDFHPTQDFPVPRVEDVPLDLEGRVRSGQTTAGAYQFSPDGVEEIIAVQGTELFVSPNPFNGSVTVSLSNYESNVQVRVINLQGQVIKDLILKPHSSTVWNTHGIPAGIYIISCLADGKQYSKRIVLIR